MESRFCSGDGDDTTRAAVPARRAGANTNPTAVRRSFFGWISGRRAADDTAYEPIPVQP